MSSPQGRFLRAGGIYLAASLANALLSLLLVPLLTRCLSPYDYGVTATATVVVQALSWFIGLGAFGLVTREQFTASHESQARLVSTSVMLGMASSLLFSLIFAVGGGWVEKLTGFPSSWAWTLVFLAFAQSVRGVGMGLLQARSEAVRYGACQVSEAAANLGLSVVWVVGLGMDWRGRMLALLATALAMTAWFAWDMKGRLRLLSWRLDRESTRQLARFGLPLIPHIAGGWVMTMSPRLFLNHMAGLGDTGLYSVAYNLAAPLQMLIGAANQAYLPALFSKLAAWERQEGERRAGSGEPTDRQEGERQAASSEPPVEVAPHRASNVERDKTGFCRLLLLVALALPLAAVALFFGVRWVLPWLVGPRFQGCAPSVFWLALAFAFNGIYYIFSNFVIYSKKTNLLSWRADFLGGLSTLVLCPIGIHFWGGTGAAVATAAAFALSCAGCITAALQAHPFPWQKALLNLASARQKPASD